MKERRNALKHKETHRLTLFSLLPTNMIFETASPRVTSTSFPPVAPFQTATVSPEAVTKAAPVRETAREETGPECAGEMEERVVRVEKDQVFTDRSWEAVKNLSEETGEKRTRVMRLEWGALSLCFSEKNESKNLRACFFAGARATVTMLRPSGERAPAAMPEEWSFFFLEKTVRVG